jgi:hypothetical protein
MPSKDTAVFLRERRSTVMLSRGITVGGFAFPI